MLVVDSIHGDIQLSPREKQIIDTASFQRLRHLKQLGMADATYPNATHTRFAHSLGVLGIMDKVARLAKEPLGLSDDVMEDIKLAGLLHDIGHYPYSHLMEGVDKVQLTEELVSPPATIGSTTAPYPSHEVVGDWIVTSQEDLVRAIGGTERAERIASLFRGTLAGEERLSRLIHSSLDMDRLDYLPRDAHATGVPYGMIDLNYILNNLRASKSGIVGVMEKALPAAEHFLFARFFMHRAVYYHKTTFGLEQACQHMLRRLRDHGEPELATDGEAIKETVTSERLGEFTDAYVDKLVQLAASHRDEGIRALADAIRNRWPPKLLKEVCVFKERGEKHHAGTVFRQNCRHRLQDLADSFDLPLSRFLVCHTKPLTLEQRGGRLTEQEARDLQPEEKEELIRVFRDGENEPVSIVSIDHGTIAKCSNHFFQSFRLYLVRTNSEDDRFIRQLSEAVADWDSD